MPKQPDIKWREIDLEKVRRAVTNFNKRIDYWAKKSPEIAESLPQKLSYKAVVEAMKEDIKYRKELNKEIRALEKFQPGKLKKSDFVEIEPGVKVTKWEYNRVKKNLEKVNALREAAAKRAQMQQISVNGVQYKAVEEAHAEQRGKPISMYKFNPRLEKSPRQGWQKFVGYVEKHMTEDKHNAALKHRDLVKQAIEGSLSGFAPEQEKLLIKLVNQVDPEKMLDGYYKGREEVDPNYIYHDPEDTWKKFDKIKKYLQSLLPVELRTLKEELKNAVRGHSVFKKGEKNYLVGLLNKIPEERLEKAAESGAPEADPAFVDMAATFDLLKERYQAMI